MSEGGTNFLSFLVLFLFKGCVCPCFISFGVFQRTGLGLKK